MSDEITYVDLVRCFKRYELAQPVIDAARYKQLLAIELLALYHGGETTWQAVKEECEREYQKRQAQ